MFGICWTRSRRCTTDTGCGIFEASRGPRVAVTTIGSTLKISVSGLRDRLLPPCPVPWARSPHGAASAAKASVSTAARIPEPGSVLGLEVSVVIASHSPLRAAHSAVSLNAGRARGVA